MAVAAKHSRQGIKVGFRCQTNVTNSSPICVQCVSEVIPSGAIGNQRDHLFLQKRYEACNELAKINQFRIVARSQTSGLSLRKHSSSVATNDLGLAFSSHSQPASGA